MMHLPVITGIIKRRLLVNFRADPAVVQRLLPVGMTPKIHQEHAVVGICLIRLEQIRPKGVPASLGISSENAAHRIAVRWDEIEGKREGVFIPRRDTDSRLNSLAGGRVFPGEHKYSEFTISDDGKDIAFSMRSDDSTSIDIVAASASSLPRVSCFSSVAEASAFFRPGCVGYSATSDPDCFDGIELRVTDWKVGALEVSQVHSSYFSDEGRFPKGSIHFDHALVMRELHHEWRAVRDFEPCERHLTRRST